MTLPHSLITYMRTLLFARFTILFTLLLIVGCGPRDATEDVKAQAEEVLQTDSSEKIEALSPQDALNSMVLQDGYKMELVAHEPMIEEPVLLTFDGNGRMYVAEMLTYMQDADGTGQMAATSRISRLQDTDNDGVVDTSTVFADNLLLPRMILTLTEGKILVRETNTLDLLLLEDLDGDGRADKRTTIYEGGPLGGNLEHQPSGLIWGIDNWLYVTMTNKRYRIKDNKVIAETIRAGSGQWGLGQDAVGRMYYAAASSERPAFAFQFPTVYGNIPVEGELADGFTEVFPIETTPDVQGGLPRVRPDNTLNQFTGVAGPSVYLGDKLPELYGNYFVPEPVGHLVRRATITRADGYTTLSHPYQNQHKEFIASADPSFRPLWSETAPDGTLYIVDMYRGIIQESAWTPKGSYLRTVIDALGLDAIVGRGRIYRVTKPGVIRDAPPAMFSQAPAQLVQYLSHPNHWWRMSAQKLIVLSQDTSVAPALKEIAKNHDNALARLHALWTLEGLNIIDQTLLTHAFADTDSDVRVAAIRISEQLFSLENPSIADQWQALIAQGDIELVQQVLLSAYYLELPEAKRESIRTDAFARFSEHKGLLAIDKINQYNLKEIAKSKKLLKENKALAEAMIRGELNYASLCADCHGADGKGIAAGDSLIAPAFAGNPRINGSLAIVGRSVLQGLTGPIDGKQYGGVMMIPLASHGDEWIADTLTYIRNSFGNTAPMVRAEQIGAIRKAEARTRLWQMEELSQRFGNQILPKDQWKLTASHNSEEIARITDGQLTNWAHWDSKKPQAPDMWVQIELPSEHYISLVELDCAQPSWQCPRGFNVEFSSDGTIWDYVDASLQPNKIMSVDALGQRTRFVRFSLINGLADMPWAISEINLYGSPVSSH